MIPFLKIKDACTVTGLSQYFLRKGCKDGSIPCVRSGPTYYVNIPALLEQLGSAPQVGISLPFRANVTEASERAGDDGW